MTYTLTINLSLFIIGYASIISFFPFFWQLKRKKRFQMIGNRFIYETLISKTGELIYSIQVDAHILPSS